MAIRVGRLILCGCAAATGVALLLCPAPARPAVIAPGVTESIAYSGLEAPVVFRFAPDGRVFVGEKTGVIKVFSGPGDTTPTVFADLRTNVFNGWDRGLLGLALHPNFPATPSVYVLYTHDAAIGGTAPRWGMPGASWDDCPTPPGPNGDGCVVSGRLSVLTASGDVASGGERVLIEDWCQQYPSHTVGSLVFGPDGALYASAGDGANFNFADYGQDGNPLNPCGDPPGGVGATLSPPTAEGGALRAQDVRTTSDPTGLDGTIIRVDAETGAGLPSNPFAFSSDPNARRIVAYGLRNPFRMTMRPGTGDLWIGDVGWGTWEEIDITTAADTTADNFGWPCYEGAARQSGYDGADLALCESLYGAADTGVVPYWAYSHSSTVVPGESCPAGSSSFAGIAFAPDTGVPDKYRNALFFADYSRDCIWVMRAGGSGDPDPALLETFVAQAANPTDLQFGPDGALYYTDVEGGTIHRLAFEGQGDQTPPSVSLTEPAAGATLTGEVSVSATATDASGIAGVQFLLDGQPLASEDTTSPYTITWNTATTSNGQHTLAARARDTQANTNTTPAITITTQNQLQNLFANGGLETDTAGWGWHQGSAARSAERAHSGSYSLRFVAAAAAGVHGVYAGSPPARIGVTAAAAYTASAYLFATAAHPDVTARIEWYDSAGAWLQTTSGQTATLPAGTWTRFAVSGNAPAGADRATVTFYFENDGGGATSYLDDFRFEGAGSGGDQTPPSVSLTEPAAGATLTGEVSVSATATDASGIAGVQFLLDGQPLASEDTTSPYTITWNTATTSNGQHTLAARARDTQANTNTTPAITITVANEAAGSPPLPEIVTPDTSTTWQVDDTIGFSGRATDPDEGVLAASRLTWALLIQHCPSNCHTHTLQQWSGIDTGSFVGPDHEYPSHLELRLTATDATGMSATTSVELYPKTVDLTFASVPSGALVTVGPTAETTPFTRTVIVGSANSVSVSSQSIDGVDYRFAGWSDGGAATHNVTAPSSPLTLTATLAANAPPTAVATAEPTSGEAPLEVSFDGSASSDPDPGETVTYAWDLDGDGAFDDATAAAPAWTYSAPGTVTVRLRVTDPHGATTVSDPIVVTIRDTRAPLVAITAPTGGDVSGIQTVTATATDAGSGIAGVRFELDGAALGVEDTSAPYAATWDTSLVPNGPHTLTALARDGAGNTASSAPVVVNVVNGVACPAGQWRAEYFPNRTLSGSPAVVRCETAIDHTWGTGSPVSGIGTNNFSVRWSGRFSFLGGPASFAATANDGIRVQLDGTPVIDQWRDQSTTTFLALRTVSSGPHDVAVEFYDRSGTAVAQVSWRERLVAAYNFNETGGTTVSDRSASGNTGSVSGASRISSGRNGRALSFDGANDWVTIGDSATLDLSTGMTLEAWVYPTALGSASRVVLGKEAAGSLVYSLYANTTSRPGAKLDLAGGRVATGPTQLTRSTWTHLAATYDGSTLRLFVNGLEVASTAASGPLPASPGPLRIGGHAVGGEWFRGRIDEVRVYARTLTAGEIQADMAAAIP